MKEIYLKYPNISISYRMDGAVGSCFTEFKEIAKGEYEYKLSVSDKVKCIRYRDTNYDCFFGVTIVDILEDGLMITASGGGPAEELKVWNKEHTAYRIETVRAPGDIPFFVPFKKWLPAAFEYRERDMYIEPCEYLYEKNRFADVLARRIDNGGKIEGEPEHLTHGIWYMHGGRRVVCKQSEHNLKNFKKVGQMELDLE